MYVCVCVTCVCMCVFKQKSNHFLDEFDFVDILSFSVLGIAYEKDYPLGYNKNDETLLKILIHKNHTSFIPRSFGMIQISSFITAMREWQALKALNTFKMRDFILNPNKMPLQQTNHTNDKERSVKMCAGQNKIVCLFFCFLFLFL